MFPNDSIVSSIVRSPISSGRDSSSPCTAEEDRWRQLAAAIIRQALLDARAIVLGIRIKSKVTRNERDAVIAEAREWLTRDNACLRSTCQQAGINCIALLEKARKEFGAPDDQRPYRDAHTGRTISDARPTKAGSLCECGLRENILD